MSANHYTLFTEVRSFYTNLLKVLETAEEQISFIYFTFDSGEWAVKFARVLGDRAAAGVRVRIMVDEVGLSLDTPRNALRNRRLVNSLLDRGVQVDIFRPTGWLNQLHRLHCKIAAIDQRTAFIGGSNIGDNYLKMIDHNFRMDGELGAVFHNIYNYMYGYSSAGRHLPNSITNLSHLTAGNAQVHLTVPNVRNDIRRALLDIIMDADQEVYLRSWYFLPDREIINALCLQARNGILVNILLSDHTRVAPVDIANYIHCHQLAKAGGQVYRYMDGFMHAKVSWNDKGQVLFGSANLDNKALKNNFECSIAVNDTSLAALLTRTFEADKIHSLLQTPQFFQNLPLSDRILSHVFNLAARWL